MSLEERLWKNVERTETCWIWTGYIKPSGHGQLQRGGRGGGLVPSHVAAYELMVGPVPKGFVVHHLCGVKTCVRPDHLEPLTREEHPTRHIKDECRRGHAFTPDNLAWVTRSSGKKERWCRACKNQRDKNYQASKRRKL